MRTYECDETCCGYGDEYSVVLTNARLIQRKKNKVCCTCHTIDSMVFLSDIGAANLGQQACCNCKFLSLKTCSTEFIMCLVLGWMCCWCSCRNRGREIPFRGGFGQENFTFDTKDLREALIDIPNAATSQGPSNSIYLGSPSPSAPRATGPKRKRK